jgi:prepilin-type N-terminal cleavage/methylation domain-containing protein
MNLKNEKGVTLLEVVLTLVVIAIILISFFQLYTQSNKTAVMQNDHLVLYHLANAELERLKLSSLELTESTNLLRYKNGPSYETILPNTAVSPSKNNWVYESGFLSSHSGKYKVQIERIPNNADESTLKIMDVVITVSSSQSEGKGVVEGYVPIIKK